MLGLKYFKTSTMKLTGLGHSELIVEMQNNKNETVRILSDSWLSDYAFGDFMERFPRLNIDWKKFPKLDGIFISHAHCDHFDPYTLTELYKHQQPELLLPETLTYLTQIIRQALPGIKIRIIEDRTKLQWKGIELYGIVFRQTYLSNEDDVMTLSMNNGKELLYIEVDTAIPETEDAYTELWEMFHEQSYDTVCHIGTRNELGGIFKSLDAQTTKERKEKVAEFLETIKEETEWDYVKYDDGFVEYSDLSRTKNYVKIFNGQGIIFPEDLGTQFDPILIPLSLQATVKQEKQIAKQYGRSVPMEAMMAGNVFEVSAGNFIQKPNPDFFTMSAKRDFTFNANTEVFRTVKSQPLRKDWPEDMPEEKFLSLIIDIINTRFLPYQIANVDAPLREMTLRSPNKKFVIALKFGNEEKSHTMYCVYSFQSMRFKIEKNNDHENPFYNEVYWARDLLDVMEGKQEMFSTFLHHLEKEKTMHLWTCLGMPFIASDFVQKKMKFHFERAKEGKDVNSYVKEVFERAKT